MNIYRKHKYKKIWSIICYYIPKKTIFVPIFDIFIPLYDKSLITSLIFRGVKKIKRTVSPRRTGVNPVPTLVF